MEGGISLPTEVSHAPQRVDSLPMTDGTSTRHTYDNTTNGAESTETAKNSLSHNEHYVICLKRY